MTAAGVIALLTLLRALSLVLALVPNTVGDGGDGQFLVYSFVFFGIFFSQARLGDQNQGCIMPIHILVCVPSDQAGHCGRDGAAPLPHRLEDCRHRSGEPGYNGELLGWGHSLQQQAGRSRSRPQSASMALMSHLSATRL